MFLIYSIILSFFLIPLTASSESIPHLGKAISTKTPTCLKEGNITIFVHGTIIPVLSKLLKLADQPHGLLPIAECKNRYRSVGKRLHQADPKKFNIDAFYIYGWSGILSIDERQNAAEKLYEELACHKGSITIIAHSHGCNVALSLADIAKRRKDTAISIDRLILFAAPVQEATCSYISSPVFKNVISCYSTADLIQVIDPQRITNRSKNVVLSSAQPFFSKRTFPHSPNLKQVRVLLNMQNPGHRSFLMAPFLKQLPEILSLIEKEACSSSEYIVNVPPRAEKPHLISQMRIAYVPRQHRTRHSRLFA